MKRKYFFVILFLIFAILKEIHMKRF